jgi:hypothetical protein
MVLLLKTASVSSLSNQLPVLYSKLHGLAGTVPYYLFQSFVSNSVLRIRIRDPVLFYPKDPGSGMNFFRIPDLGSRIPIPNMTEIKF